MTDAHPKDVRAAHPADWAVLKALRLRALSEDPQAFCTTLAAAQALPDRFWRDLAAGKTGQLYLGFGGGRCQAMARLLDENAPAFLHLTSMWVAPEARGTGLGKRLLEAAHQDALRSGAEALTLDVIEDNTGAVDFYKAYGFQPTERSAPLAPPRSHLTERTYSLGLA